jgi:YfiH family protein
MMAVSSIAARLARAGLDWIVPQWVAPANVHALVTTRSGGVSAPPCDTMNLGSARAGGDDASAVAENRRRLRAFVPSEPVWLSQVHGTSVARLDGTRAASPIVADAATTRVPGIVCAVLVADCMPVLLADRAGTVVGIAHAGWRGLAAGVVEATLEQMGVAAENVVAWLGPAIGARRFEVGADVHAAFVARDTGDARAFVAIGGGKWLADLDALARARLARAGVREIAGGGWCTHGDPARFFSYRRDRDTGRMAALLWLEGAPV